MSERPHAPGTVISAQEISRMLGQTHPPTIEQQRVIEAPLEPFLVVAGAGSGKTETMSARVVWLIVNGFVEPREVLGLTFTRQAAFELNERIETRLADVRSALIAHNRELVPALARSDHEMMQQRPHVHTYNGFALDIVTEHALRIGLDSQFTVLTPAAAWQMAFDLVESWPAELPFHQRPAAIASAVLALAGSLADHLVHDDTLEEYLRMIAHEVQSLPLALPEDESRARTMPREVRGLLTRIEQRRALVPLLRAFAQRKRERSAIDFADQVRLAAEIARSQPAVAHAMREQYKVVLLDEFQDTSVGQLQLLATLFGHGHATCAVGDPNQAIYGWRGASAASLTQFTELFASDTRAVEQFTLSTSFRNDALILKAANAMAAHVNGSDEIVDLTLASRPGAGPGRVSTAYVPDTDTEAQTIARWLVQGRQRAGEDREPPSCAILVRTRSMIAPLVSACAQAGLPYHVVASGGLLHEPEVADVRALLEVVDSSERTDALMRLLDGPRVGLGARDIAVLGAWLRSLRSRDPHAERTDALGVSLTLTDTLEHLPPVGFTDDRGRCLSEVGRERLVEFAALLRRMRAHAHLELGDLVSLAIEVLHVDIAVLADPSRPVELAMANLDEFRRHAHAYSASAERPSLGAFLAFLDVSEEREAALAAVDAPAPEGAVTISTIHASKGLEWDMVAIAGLADGALPSYTRPSARKRDPETGWKIPREPGWLADVATASIPVELRGDSDILPELAWAQAGSQVQLEERIEEFKQLNGAEKIREESRLMYVALTRARTDLLLTYAAWCPGLTSPMESSRFMDIIAQVDGVHELVKDDTPEANPLESAPEKVHWPCNIALPADAGQLSAPDGTRIDEGFVARAKAATDHVIAAHVHAQTNRAIHLPLRLSPSDLVALTDDPSERLADIVRPLPRRPSAHAALGTRFHAWVHSSAHAPALLDAEDLHEVGVRDGQEDDAPVDPTALEDLREAFERSDFASMRPLGLEVPVTLTLSSAHLPGVIDAVYEDPDDPETVWIVDWKTGRVPRGRDLDTKALQLSVYRLAWHQSTGMPLENIRTFFHYVAHGRTIEIRRHVSEAEIERMLSIPTKNPDGHGTD